MQAFAQLVTALKDNQVEDAKALWKQTSLDERQRAKAAYYAFLWNRDPFIAWMLKRPEFAVDPLLSLIGECTVDKLLLHRFDAGSPPSKEVLRAAIKRHLPITSLDYFTSILLEVGGQELALSALDSGYEISFLAVERKPVFARFLNEEFFQELRNRRFPFHDSSRCAWRLWANIQPQMAAENYSVSCLSRFTLPCVPALPQ
eukprot:jgi/Botrbrau1/17460/Bobra.0054s0048.1